MLARAPPGWVNKPRRLRTLNLLNGAPAPPARRRLQRCAYARRREPLHLRCVWACGRFYGVYVGINVSSPSFFFVVYHLRPV